MSDNPMATVLNLRAAERWPELIEFIGTLPAEVQSEQRFQRQLALALNREGRSEEAERILLGWVDAETADDKTLGILGRVYRDRWENNPLGRDDATAEPYLQRAIEMYSRGFDRSERKNTYPAINFLTLLVISNPDDPRIPGLAEEIYLLLAAKLSAPSPDYFDYATQLELAVDVLQEDMAWQALKGALPAAVPKGNADEPPRGTWALRTTAHNLQLLRTAREERGGSPPWATAIEGQLLGVATPHYETAAAFAAAPGLNKG